MENIIAILMVFGMPVVIVFIVKYFKALEKGLVGPRARAAVLPPAEKQKLDALVRERQVLESRLQNLETIVCSVDLELNARLSRLAAEQSRLGLSGVSAARALPAAPVAMTGGAAVPGGTAAPVAMTGRAAAPVAAIGGTAATGAASASPSAAPLAGTLGGEIRVGQTLLGRYHVEKELGRGGMGAVYLARDAELGEVVALKVISNALCCDNLGAVERFRREASSARKITHPNVIRIHDLGAADGVLFISMEYFAGMTLADLLGRRGALPLDEARDIVSQVADGLAAAHGVGVIHRDLKPQNVLVDAGRRVKLIDFGLAKASFLDGMTATGLILGTPEYMAPEQVRGRPVDARTDIYAFGCVIYHMLAGVPPFRAETPIAVGFLHCTQAPVPVRQLRPEISPAMEAAVMRALAKDPQARFNTVEELQRTLLG